MTLVGRFVSCIVVCFPIAGSRQTENTVTRLELLDPITKHKTVHGKRPDVPLGDIRAFIEISTIQTDVDQGIEFLVDIVNEGAEPIELLDPADERIHIRLRNAAGVRVALPPIRPEALVCKLEKRPPDMLATFRAERDARRAYRVWEAELGNLRTHKTLRDIQRGKVRLDAGDHFQIRVQVDQVIGDPERYWSEREKRHQRALEAHKTQRAGESIPLPDDYDPIRRPQIVPISAGIYTLKVGVRLSGTYSLIDQDGDVTSERRVRPVFSDLEGRTVQSDVITVHLGRK